MHAPRRKFLSSSLAFVAAGFGVPGFSAGQENAVKNDKENESAEEISAPEDLMREHEPDLARL
jgi:hypothetical protein